MVRSFYHNRNSADNGKGGGGITIAQGSGVVNVAGCDFANNEASYGGAISHEGSRLNIVGSRFVMNQAMKTVSLFSLLFSIQANNHHIFDGSNSNHFIIDIKLCSPGYRNRGGFI